MHVVFKGGHCLSAARSTSLKELRQRQSCFHSSISICTQSSWPLRHQTSATGATFLRNNSGDDNNGWEHDGDADDTYFSTVNHTETSNFWTLTPLLFIHLPSRSIFLGVPSWAGWWFRVHEGSHGDHSIFSEEKEKKAWLSIPLSLLVSPESNNYTFLQGFFSRLSQVVTS